ncbi:MAG: hypothetical protein KDN22_28455 [Verrucomicrobiae bacterium]|nr:hypothetical protein [Verrucomicrobiae bacterium]
MINLQTILLISRALLHDKEARRKLMFYSCIVTMVLVFGGVFLPVGAFQKSPVLSIIYVAVCFASVLFMLLLALYDLLAVRAQHRSEMRKLRKQIQEGISDESKA